MLHASQLVGHAARLLYYLYITVDVTAQKRKRSRRWRRSVTRNALIKKTFVLKRRSRVNRSQQSNGTVGFHHYTAYLLTLAALTVLAL